MKTIILFLSVCLFCPPAVLAERPYTETKKLHTFEAGFYLSGKTYREEEGDFMKDSAFMKGFYLNWQYHNKIYLSVENIFAFGSTDYSNPMGQSADNIPETMSENRLIIGYDIITRNTLVLVSYTGFGYRRMSMDGTGIETAPGYYLYDRVSNYYYLPVGIELEKNLKGWDIETILEYDFLIEGRQESYLSQVAYWYPDVKNDQKSGFGLKARVSFVKRGSRVDWVLTPFINYWKISESEHITTIIYPPASPPLLLEVWEPRNDSFEWGVRFSVKV